MVYKVEDDTVPFAKQVTLESRLREAVGSTLNREKDLRAAMESTAEEAKWYIDDKENSVLIRL